MLRLLAALLFLAAGCGGDADCSATEFLAPPCTPLCPSLRYLSAPPTPTTDATCLPITACPEGLVQAVAPTATSDRRCAIASYPWSFVNNATLGTIDQYASIDGSVVISAGLVPKVLQLSVLKSVSVSVQLANLAALAVHSILFHSLQVVGSDLEIFGNSVSADNTLLTLVSLPALQFVGGSVHVGVDEHGPAFLSLAHILLPEVAAVWLDVFIHACPRLDVLDLSKLETVLREIKLSNSSLSGGIHFPALGSTVSSLFVSSVSRTTVLETPALTSIDRDLQLGASKMLATIVFHALARIGGLLNISHEPSLTSIMLPSLNIVGGSVFICCNDVLAVVNLPALTLVFEYLLINSMVSSKFGSFVLSTVNLPILSYVGDRLNFYDFGSPNLAWATTAFIQSLATVRRGFSFTGSIGLTSLFAPNMTTVGTEIVINKHADLVSLSFPVLSYIGSNLELQGNRALTALCLPALIRLGGFFDLEFQAAITLLNVPLLSFIGGNMRIFFNPSLQSITLPRVARIGGFLDISGSGGMTALAVPLLSMIGGYVNISQNPHLFFISTPRISSIGDVLMVCSNSASLAISQQLISAAWPQCFTSYTASCITTVPCNYTSFTSITNMNVSALLNATSISGSVSLNSSGLLTLVAPSLTAIGGKLFLLHEDRVAVISMPLLTYVGNGVFLNCSKANNTALTLVSMPLLAHVGSQFAIGNDYGGWHTALTLIYVPVLSVVGGYLEVKQLPSLSSQTFLSVATVGMNVAVLSDPSLTAVYAPQLTLIAGSLLVISNENLARLEMPLLAIVQGNTIFTVCPRLTLLSFPSLLLANGSLVLFVLGIRSLSLPLLTWIGTFAEVQLNSYLSSVAISRLSTITGVCRDPSGTYCSPFGSAANSVMCSNNVALVVPQAFLKAVGPHPCYSSLPSDGDSCMFNGSSRCDTIFTMTGDVNAATVGALSNFTAIAGSILLSGSTVASLVAPTIAVVSGTVDLSSSDRISVVNFAILTWVGGSISLSSSAAGNSVLTALCFPQLQYIGISLLFNLQSGSYFGALTAVVLPALTVVGSDFFLAGCSILTHLSLPALESVGGQLSVTNMTALTALHVPVLTAVFGLQVAESNALLLVSAPQLVALSGVLLILNCLNLSQVALPRLDFIGGYLYVAGTNLSSIAVPPLTWIGGFVLIQSNSELTFVSLPALTSIRGLCDDATGMLCAPINASVDSAFCYNNPQFFPPRNVLGAVGGGPCAVPFFPGSPSCVRLPGSCNTVGTFAGDISSFNIGLLSELSTLNGSIYTANSGTPRILSTYLEVVLGNVTISNEPQLTLVQMTALTLISGGVEISSPSSSSASLLTAIVLPRLSRIGFDLILANQTQLLTVAFAALNYLGGYLSVSSCITLTALVFPQLTIIGGAITIQMNSQLSTLAMPSLLRIFANGVFDPAGFWAVKICANSAASMIPGNIPARAKDGFCFFSPPGNTAACTPMLCE